LNILNGKGNFNNLKYINLTLDEIKESDNMYNILSNLIENSNNLKSLILRIHPNNFNQFIPFIFKSIQKLSELRILNISQNCDNPIYDNIYLQKKIDEFPKLKLMKNIFDEFKIGNDGFILNQNKKYQIFNYNIKYKHQIINNKSDRSYIEKSSIFFNMEINNSNKLDDNKTESINLIGKKRKKIFYI
jgi:hypothetical protein